MQRIAFCTALQNFKQNLYVRSCNYDFVKTCLWSAWISHHYSVRGDSVAYVSRVLFLENCTLFMLRHNYNTFHGTTQRTHMGAVAVGLFQVRFLNGICAAYVWSRTLWYKYSALHRNYATISLLWLEIRVFCVPNEVNTREYMFVFWGWQCYATDDSYHLICVHTA